MSKNTNIKLSNAQMGYGTSQGSPMGISTPKPKTMTSMSSNMPTAIGQSMPPMAFGSMMGKMAAKVGCSYSMKVKAKANMSNKKKTKK